MPLSNESLSKELNPEDYIGPAFTICRSKPAPAPSINIRSDISGTAIELRKATEYE